jgi:hypothetical protein
MTVQGGVHAAKTESREADASPEVPLAREDCQRGYQAALKKCMESWDLYAWLYYRIRGYYRRKE